MPGPSGAIPQAVRDAFGAGLFELPARAPGLATSATQSLWRVPVIMVGFVDQPLTYAPGVFDAALFDDSGANPTGSVTEYFDWVSGGQLRVEGQVVAAIQFTDSSRTRLFYANNSWGLNSISTPNNIFGMIRDAMIAIDDMGLNIDWSSFDNDNDGFVDMLWVVHAGHGGESAPWDRNNIWSITSRLSSGWRLGGAIETNDPVPGSTTQRIRLDRFSTLPELSGFIPTARSEIGVYCHEFGHALGLPDLYDTSQFGGAANSGPGNWSLMSTGGWGANGVTPETPTHVGAWPSVFLGWKTPVRPSRDTTIALPPLAEGGDVIQFWFQGEDNAEHFLLENRQRIGFDANLPSEGLLVYQVDEAVIGARLQSNSVNAGLTPGLRVVEADGDSDLVVGANRGDGNDPFPGLLGRTSIDEDTSPSTRTFLGRVTNLALRDIEVIGDDVWFRAEVEAQGWLPAEDGTGVPFSPLGSGGSPDAMRSDDGTLHVIRSELIAGAPQVILRSGSGGMWNPPFQVSNSSGSALDPVAALLPGGDIVVVWSDTRGGGAHLYYRMRLGGAWTNELRILDRPGDSRNPAIAIDDDGLVHLAWLQVDGGLPDLLFARFAYTSPFGHAFTVTDSTFPAAPTVALGPDGDSYIVWSDRGINPQRIQFAHFHPDSGVSFMKPLTPLAFGAQTAVRSVVGSDGTLHSVWVENTTGLTQIRYQQRTPAGFPSPPDQVLASHGNAIENLDLAIDSSGALHLAFERNVDGTLQVRYKRWRDTYDWDLVATNVTEIEDGDATFPLVVPESAGTLTVFFTGHQAGQPRFMTRRRELDAGAPVVSVVVEESPRRPFALYPNPLRAGQALEIHAAAAGRHPAVLDVFDIAGRRIASTTLAPTTSTRFGRIAGTRTAGWPGGVYFARLRGDSKPATRLVVLR